MMRLRILKSAENNEEHQDDEDNLPHFINVLKELLFLVPGGTYFHLEPSHSVHARQSKD